MAFVLISDLFARTITAVPSFLVTATWGATDALCIVGLVVERQAILKLAYAFRAPLFGIVLSIVALNMLSAAWSEQPFATIRSAIGLGCGVAAALYFAVRLGLRGCIEAIAFSIALEAVISVILVVVSPASGLMQTEYVGSWRGMFLHKNIIGQAMDVGMISLACIFASLRTWVRALCAVILVVEIACLIGSQSATAVGALMLIFFAAAFLLRARVTISARTAAIVSIVAIVCIGAAFALGGLTDAGSSILGRDSSLTGRTDIWKFAIESIQQRPVLGFGYRGFWRTFGLNFAQNSSSWQPVHAHNGYIEVGLNGGLVGLTFLALFVIVSVRATWRSFWQAGSGAINGWPLAITLFAIVTNFSEPSYEYYRNTEWFFTCVAFFTALVSLHIGSARAACPEREGR